jgi:hypothetical protein
MNARVHVVLTLLLLACAATRLLIGDGRAVRVERRAPELPAALEGQRGEVAPLDRSEQVLAAAPGVALARRSYGPTQVALLTVSGLKEHHPPTVCLKAAGYEVTDRAEEQSAHGCLTMLRLRRSGAAAYFFYTYFDGQRTTCSFWARVGRGALAQLAGRGATWSTLQVMDRDHARARRAITTLLTRLERRRTI